MIWKVFGNISARRSALPSMSNARRLHYEGSIYRFKFLMIATLLCAALTVIGFILGQVKGLIVMLLIFFCIIYTFILCLFVFRRLKDIGSGMKITIWTTLLHFWLVCMECGIYTYLHSLFSTRLPISTGLQKSVILLLIN